MVSTITLCKLGANVEACENEKEGLDQICKGLSDGREGHANLLPYDYILMDCQVSLQCQSPFHFHLEIEINFFIQLCLWRISEYQAIKTLDL